MRPTAFCLAAALFCAPGWAQSPGSSPQPSIVIVKNAYNGSREEAELSRGPDALEQGGLADIVRNAGAAIAGVHAAKLTPEEDKQYGAWNRMGMANAHLGKLVSGVLKEDRFPIGLLANCNSLMGMLGGLQHSGRSARPLRVGLVWIDAHSDFNTPETTLSGMLGGMPVAVSTGLCLTRFRMQSGLDPALPFSYVVMVGVRDIDPLEQELVDRSGIERVATADIRPPFEKLVAQVNRLSGITDLIYVHIDMDVLDPAEVSGHSLNVAGGPDSRRLGAALEAIFTHPKTVALGIASYPSERDPQKLSLKAAYNLIEGCIRGVRQRGNAR
jgi:arginase